MPDTGTTQQIDYNGCFHSTSIDEAGFSFANDYSSFDSIASAENGHRMVLRAQTEIKEGDEITIQVLLLRSITLLHCKSIIPIHY